MKKWDEQDKGGEGQEPPPPTPTPKTNQNLRQKLKKISGKRGGQLTPVLRFPLHIGAQDSSNNGAQDSNPGLCLTVSSLPLAVSARKLGATVWELDQYNLPFAKMHHGGGTSRRNHKYLQLNRHHHHRHHLLEENPEPSPELVNHIVSLPFLVNKVLNYYSC